MAVVLYRPLHLPLLDPALEDLPLVRGPFALGQGHLHLGEPPSKVEPGGNQSEAPLDYPSDELLNLLGS